VQVCSAGGEGASENEGGGGFGSIMLNCEDGGGGGGGEGASEIEGGGGSVTDCGDEWSTLLEIHSSDANGNGEGTGNGSDGENVGSRNQVEKDEDEDGMTSWREQEFFAPQKGRSKAV
jgi:hypothetical protein